MILCSHHCYLAPNFSLPQTIASYLPLSRDSDIHKSAFLKQEEWTVEKRVLNTKCDPVINIEMSTVIATSIVLFVSYFAEGVSVFSFA